MSVEGHWQAVARTTLRDNIYNLQRMLCTQVLSESRQRAPEQASTNLDRASSEGRRLPASDRQRHALAARNGFRDAVRRTPGCAAHGRRISFAPCPTNPGWKTHSRSSRPEHLEPRKPVHGLGRRRPDRAGPQRGQRRGPTAESRRLRVRSRVHLDAEARGPHAVDDPRRDGSDVAAGRAQLAPERAALRRAAGAEQSADGREARRGSSEDLAA